MKIKGFIGAVVALGATMLLASSVFAADTIELGKAYDVTEGKNASSLTVGHVIAVPFDITSDTNGITSFELNVKYDTTVLSGGVPSSDLASIASNIIAIDKNSGKNLILDSDANKYVGIGLLQSVTTDFLGQKEYSFLKAADYVSNATYTADSMFLTVSSMDTLPTDNENTGKLEGYFLFKVIAEPADSVMNKDIVEIVADKTLIADDNNGKPGSAYGKTTNTTDAKANACAVAIKIKIDSNALKDAGIYLHGLQVKVGSGTAVDVLDLIDNGDGTYSFPIRFIDDSNSAPILSGVKLIAKVAATETAEDFDEKTVTLDGIALGAPTDYTDTSVTIS